MYTSRVRKVITVFNYGSSKVTVTPECDYRNKLMIVPIIVKLMISHISPQLPVVYVELTVVSVMSQ